MRAGMVVLILEDLVSGRWLTEIVNVEETHTHVELAVTVLAQAAFLTVCLRSSRIAEGASCRARIQGA
jgi:hypothetical protein